MKSFNEKYKNIDKSTSVVFNNNKNFKVLHLTNKTQENQYFKYLINSNHIQLYFSKNNESTVAFNLEHCAIKLNELNSYYAYFKDTETTLLFQLPKNAETVAIFISIDFFHSLFADNSNVLFNFNLGKPIIEPKKISHSVNLILNQITNYNLSPSLKSVYIQGKIYELLSHYFTPSNYDIDEESCPFIANEETVSKIKQVKEIIIEQISNPPSLTELAKEVGLNIKKLKTGFKDVYGYPVFTFLLNYKMELAKKLLQDNQLNVNEIALQLGYSSSSHFIAAFKKKYGITPKQFSKIK